MSGKKPCGAKHREPNGDAYYGYWCDLPVGHNGSHNDHDAWFQWDSDVAFDDYVVRVNAARLRRGMPAQQVLKMIERYVRSSSR